MWDIKPAVCWRHRAIGRVSSSSPPSSATHKSISDHRPHLWTDPLHSIHHNDAPITDANRCWYFGGEIHVARGVNQIYQVLLITWNKIWRHTFSCADKQASSCKPGKTLLRQDWTKAPGAKASVGRYPVNFTTIHAESNSLSSEHWRTSSGAQRVPTTALEMFNAPSTYRIIKLSMR